MQLQTPTKEIITPNGQHKVVIKEWITGEDREYINEPMYTSVDVQAQKQPGIGPKTQTASMDVNKYITESDHRELEKFVVSVEGEKEIEFEGKKIPAWQAILKMHEEDTAFVKKEIAGTQKKKDTQTTS